MLKVASKSVVAAAVAMLVVPALADFSTPPVPLHLTRISGYYSGGGGEFTVTPGAELTAKTVTGTFSDLTEDSFQTFCVEINEYVGIPGNYYADINTFAASGGAGGQDALEGPGGTPSDSLDPRTAYLYQNFRMGTLLTSYNYTVSRWSDAGALQSAIWYTEGEISSLCGNAVSFYDEAVTATGIGTLYDGSVPGGTPTWFGLGNVRILNLWSDSDRSGFRQDQLTMVPAPGGAMLGVIGLGAIGCIRRRVS